MNSNPILTPKQHEAQRKIPITLPPNPRTLIKHTQGDAISSLREGKKCFKACIKPVNQDLKKFESCLTSCIIKSNEVTQFLRTTDYINAVLETPKQKKK